MTIAKKGVCAACNRPIQQSTHDKCLYCGEPLLAHQRYSAEEKAKIEALRQQREDEWQAEQKRRIQERRETTGSRDAGGGTIGGDADGCGGE